MDIILIIITIIFGYLGALITTTATKHKPVEALNGGTAAWILVVMGSLFAEIDSVFILAVTLAFGILIQVILQIKDDLDTALK